MTRARDNLPHRRARWSPGGGARGLGDIYAGTDAFWVPDSPPTSRVGYQGAPQTIKVMRRACLDDSGHLETRQIAESVCEGLDSKDYVSEYLALYQFLLGHSRYMRDPRRTELVRAPYVISRQILSGHRPSLDCLPADTLLLRKGFEFVALKDVRAGDQIWGRDRWSTVGGTVYKGTQPVDAVAMNNGSTFCATPDHLVYVQTCSTGTHPRAWLTPGGYSRCPCGPQTTRVRVADLQPGMVLVQPDRLPFGEENMDVDRALIEGLYASDGWHQPYCFQISGQDGCPKEDQKREVEEACNRLGIPTTWYRKSIMVRDSEWARRIELMGSHAPDKHVLGLNLSEGPAAALLRGIMADSGQNTNGDGRTFTTTSYQLFLQTRVLLKMFGVTCGERFIANHGGLGKNPIWRLQTRVNRQDQSNKILRVKNIERNVASVPVYDIQTDDHYVYLPAADITVSNCDDMSTWLAAAITAVGGRVEFCTVAFAIMFFGDQQQYSHVFTRALEPRTHVSIILDPVAAEKTPQMLRRVKAAAVYPVAA